MPESIWGTGTMYYGDSEYNRDDQSWVVTEWVTFMWIPILPLGSYRIYEGDEEKTYHLFPPGMTRTMYHDRVRVKLRWKHVWKLYGITLLVATAIAIIIYVINKEGG